MEEKVFDLLEKLYIEVQEMKSNMATKDELRSLESSMATKDDIRKLESSMVRMENEIKDDIKYLYDGYKQCIKGISTVNKKLDKLTDKVRNQEIKLQVLKSAK